MMDASAAVLQRDLLAALGDRAPSAADCAALSDALASAADPADVAAALRTQSASSIVAALLEPATSIPSIARILDRVDAAIDDHPAGRLLAAVAHAAAPVPVSLWLELASGAGIAAADAESMIATAVDDGIVGRIEGEPLLLALPAVWRARLRRRDTAAASASARARRASWWARIALEFSGTWFGAGQAARFRSMRIAARDLLDLADAGAATATAGGIATSLAALWPLWTSMGEGDRIVRRIDAALGVAELDDAAAFRIHWASAWLSLNLADIGAATRSIDAMRALEPGPDAARLDQIVGIRALYAGDADRAALELAAALAVHDRDGTDDERFVDLSFLAAAESLRGDQQGAGALCERAVALCERNGERWIRIYVLWAFALSAWRAGDDHRAEALALDGIEAAVEIGDADAAAICCEVVAWHRARHGDPVVAATLLGLIDGMRTRTGVPTLTLGADAAHDDAVAVLIERLGGPAFWRFRRAGTALELDDAMRLLAQPTEPSPLSARQGEIARRIALGSTNKQIAHDLLITQRTVETHIEHIFARLGVTSRAQIAAWVASRR